MPQTVSELIVLGPKITDFNILKKTFEIAFSQIEGKIAHECGVGGLGWEGDIFASWSGPVHCLNSLEHLKQVEDNC